MTTSLEQVTDGQGQPLAEHVVDQRAAGAFDELEVWSAVEGVASQLTPAHRELLPYLRDGASLKEIAAALGLETGAVKMRVRRLRDRLLDLLPREWASGAPKQRHDNQQTDEDQTSTSKEGDRDA